MSTTAKYPEYYIEFSENYPKLQSPLFTTVRLHKNTTYYTINRVYAIYVQGMRKGFAQLLNKQTVKLRDITLPLIRFDTYSTVTFDEFYRKMTQFYCRKSPWHGLDTLMLILYLLWVERL